MIWLAADDPYGTRTRVRGFSRNPASLKETRFFFGPRTPSDGQFFYEKLLRGTSVPVRPPTVANWFDFAGCAAVGWGHAKKIAAQDWRPERLEVVRNAGFWASGGVPKWKFGTHGRYSNRPIWATENGL